MSNKIYRRAPHRFLIIAALLAACLAAAYLPAPAALGARRNKGVLRYDAPPARASNRMTLRLRGGELVLTDDAAGRVLQRRPLATTRAVVVRGADGRTEDTLTVDFAGGEFTLPGGVHFDGGAGGYDTLNVFGGIFQAGGLQAINAHSGVFTFDGLRISYANLEPTTNTTTETNFTFNATAGDDQIVIEDGPIAGGTTQTTRIRSANNTFETLDFANKTNVTVNGLGGNDTVSVEIDAKAAGLTTLRIDGGANTDSLTYVTPRGGDSLIVNSPGAGQNTVFDNNSCNGASCTQTPPTTFTNVENLTIDTAQNDGASNMDSVTVNDPGFVAAGLQSVLITTGAGTDSLQSLNVYSLPAAGGGIQIDMGAERDSFSSSGASDFTVSDGGVTAPGLGGSVVFVNDSAETVSLTATAPNTFTVQGWTHNCGGQPPSNCGEVVQLNGDTGTNTYHITGAMTGNVSISEQGSSGVAANENDVYVVDVSDGAGFVGLTSFDPQGSNDVYTVNGTAGNDSMTVNANEGGNFTLQVKTSTGYTAAFGQNATSSIESLVINGGGGSDSFDVTPLINGLGNTTFAINGGDPPPPAVPGDLLKFTEVSAGTPTRNASFDPSGGWSGTYSYSGARPVTFSQVESLTPGPANAADVGVTKTDSPDTVLAGGDLTYTIQVSNTGAAPASGVQLSDAIPANTTFLSLNVPAGWAPTQVPPAGGTGTVTATRTNPMPSGTLNETFTLVVRVNQNSPSGTVITNTATVSTTTTDSNPSNDSAAATTTVLAAGAVVISEFRLRGPGGPLDEFVELYNATNGPITVASSDGSSGWAVAASDGVARCVVPNNTVIPARGHFLCANTGYSLAAYPAEAGAGAAADAAFANTTDIPDNSGIALFTTSNAASFAASTPLDAVGFTAAPAPYREGAGLANPVSADAEHSFVRDLRSGRPKDTNDNAADFLLVAVDPTAAGLTGARRGAPGPETLEGPVQRNDRVKASLIEPTSSNHESPNAVRTGTGDSGTFSIRRRWTNSTGATITRLRFRVVRITTQGSPAEFASQADLRPATSGDEAPITTSLGTVTVKGTTVELVSPGGHNSTMSADVGGGLAPGASIDVQFRLDVAKAGAYAFFVNVEAGPPPAGPAVPAKQSPQPGKAGGKRGALGGRQ